MKTTILLASVLVQFGFMGASQAYTLKCPKGFTNDVNARAFTLEVSDKAITFILDSTGEKSVSRKMNSKLLTLTKYSSFTQAFSNEPYAPLLNPDSTIAIPKNLEKNPISVRYYDSVEALNWGGAECELKKELNQ